MRSDDATLASGNEVVIATFAATPGGLWQHVVDLASGLRADGWRVQLGLLGSAEALRRECAPSGFPVVDLGSFWRSRRLSHRRSVVLHLHLGDTFDRAAFRLSIAARLLGYIVIITEHLPRTNASDWRLDGGSRNRVAKLTKSFFKSAQFLAADRVIAVSDGSRSFLCERYAVRPRKIVTVPNGVDISKVSLVSPLSGGRPVARYVVAGSLIRQKGVDVLLEASRLAQREWTVDVHGDGPHRNALEALANREAAERRARVRFVGWSPGVREVLRDYDALVLPSRWESAPYIVLEAMAQARAVVGTRVDGLREMVDVAEAGITECGDATGILVEPGDAAGLAQALDALADSRETLRSMGLAGRRKVERCYALNDMVRRTASVYRTARRSM